MEWEKRAEEKFKAMIDRIPVFHRRITQEVVVKKAAENAVLRNAGRIEEEDIIRAFFSDVPSAFYSMMIRLLDQSGFDYRKYGFPGNGDTKTKG